MEILKKDWKHILVFFLVIISIAIIWYEWREHKSIPSVTLPTVTQGNVVTKDDLAKALATLNKDSSSKHVQTLRETIIEREKSAPDQLFKSKTQEESDKKSGEIAKKDSADFVLKQPKSVASGEIQNYYYGIHKEKNTKIKAGFTVGGYNSLNVGVQHKKVEVVYHKSLDIQRNDSITAMGTVLEW